MAKKEPIYRGLSELPVQVEDRSINSPDYFRIIKMPAEFTAGINTIKFKGNPSLFVNESAVDIEILDSNGSPIYYETGLDLESAQQNAVINVYINQDTAPGIGTVYICGTIAKDAKGKVLPPASLNLRWQAPINIDISKRNSVDILYTALPTVTISSTSGAYTNLGFPGGKRIVSQSYTLAAGQLTYFNYNNQPLLSTGSRATFAFTSSAISSNVIITSNNLTNVAPSLPSNLGILTYSSSIKEYSGNGIAVLSDPIVFKNPNGLENYVIKSAGVTGLTYVVEQSASLASSGTENSFNTAVVYFSNLSPQAGQVAKLRSYYKSSGVGEYVLSNETDISSFASEEGFTPNTFTASFAIPTTHRNDRLDFKFEFINPSGIVSKQVLESKNHLFLGGNTYVGGDDNLLTGSLYVAGSTGTGVHISGKGSAAMIRSIGYNGFQRATTQGPGGFVMYSGSIQPLLNASESYSGVGLELVANSASYFKYTTAGNGLLDIRTANFFLGNGSNSISGSNGNITISGSAVSIATPTFFLGSNLSYVSGSGQNIKIATAKQYIGDNVIGDPWFGQYYMVYSSGSIVLSGSNVNINTPTIQIGTDANYIRAANGQITIASGYGQIGESYQLISEPFELPEVYDLRPVYGNGSILISGSNVEIKTPKFFLGDSNTSISGSNGNIRISGSNVDVLTSKFFLGNPSTFISGSGNNIRISGSNVTVSTPSFLLGNGSTFISGSNGNILVSGSNVRISTPTFFLGSNLSYVSGSGQNIKIATSKVLSGFYDTDPYPAEFPYNRYYLYSSGSITLSGSNVNINTPTIQIGTDANYIRAANGQITIASGYGQIGESYQYVGGGGDWFDPYQYDLLPVYGNGSILISGSNVEIKTPKFFLGDSNTSISGSNGNIVISGSNVRVSTPTFFLGNGSSFISGSNNNIRISGSNVTVSTPSFLLGNQTTFISGSNGSILISGSNVTMLTPKFNFGTTASYISGSDGKVSIYSTKFILTGTGIVTASGIFIPAQIQDGSTDPIYAVMNPADTTVDGVNIGRHVGSYIDSSNSLLFTTSSDATFNRTGSGIASITFQKLIGETSLHISSYIIHTQTGSLGNSVLPSGLFCNIYYIPTASTSQPQFNGSGFTLWQPYASDQGINAFGRPTLPNASGSIHRARLGASSFVLSLPSTDASMWRIDLYSRLRTITPTRYTGSIAVPYINCTMYKNLAGNFGLYPIVSPDYSAIGAPGLPPGAQ